MSCNESLSLTIILHASNFAQILVRKGNLLSQSLKEMLNFWAEFDSSFSNLLKSTATKTRFYNYNVTEIFKEVSLQRAYSLYHSKIILLFYHSSSLDNSFKQYASFIANKAQFVKLTQILCAVCYKHIDAVNINSVWGASNLWRCAVRQC